jgi:cell division protein FtsL
MEEDEKGAKDKTFVYYKERMSNGEQNVQQQEVLTPAQRVKSDWRSLVEKVSYKAIVNNIPYLAFVVLLCVLYISNSHRALEMQRELNMQHKALQELRWKYMDTKSQLMYVKTETQVIKNAENIGLKPSLLPAYKISNSKFKIQNSKKE